jgi:hypothetical protein
VKLREQIESGEVRAAPEATAREAGTGAAGSNDDMPF